MPGALGEVAKMGASLAGCSDVDCEAMVDDDGGVQERRERGEDDLG